MVTKKNDEKIWIRPEMFEWQFRDYFYALIVIIGLLLIGLWSWGGLIIKWLGLGSGW